MTQDSNNSSGRLHNMDLIAMASFAGAAALGLFNTVNNIRHEFYQSFIAGWNRVPTAFTDLKNHFEGLQRSNLTDYQAGTIDSATYRQNIQRIANENQAAVNERLLKDFNIPTNGFRGWTEGTYKRFKEIGRTSRVNAGIGFATTAAITIGALALLRHNKDTLDKIDTKLELDTNAQTLR